MRKYRRAIVTGATGGIGQCVTERLLRENYDVLALHRHPENAAVFDGYKDRLPGETRVDTMAMDLGSPSQEVLLVRALEREDAPCDLLVVCHGHAPVPPALQHEQFTDLLMTDVVGTHRVCFAVARWLMLPFRRGCIVLVSSLHAQRTYPHRAAYATAKSAVCGLARALAVEWGPYNVRVNVILPWQCEGERTTHFVEEGRATTGEDLLEHYRQRSPLRRLVQPEEIAETVLWLAGCPSITGAEIVMDAGVSASMWHKGFLEETLSATPP